ncbi:hypothetical protein [Moritella viscosa]|uniref:Lipoprotein n=2 Tax=Moritella viscosa TaxID=80854 RepID=A0ABY1HHF6_9GAMM|nr:hypothetical protein [Moritella viscosa]SGY98960.1 Putative uncharacterized protein [Moritella viscosa]SGZ13554.1 Putative uncharacterized protein [Moritella viscosa]SHO27837.1 Putative uncharacterized protein [Moritella viscosa]
MLKKIFVAVCTASLVACGGSGGGDCRTAPTKSASNPEVINVSFKNLDGDVIELGDELKGSYTFISASIPTAKDASDIFWEIGGNLVHKGSRYRIPMDNNYVGLEIHFCVNPINRGDRLEGNKTCSTPLLIDSKYVPATPKVSIPNAATNNIVGSPLNVWVFDDSDYSTTIQWYRNSQPILGITQDQYQLTSDDEGQKISVCVFDKKTKIKLACSGKTNAIQPQQGERPDVDLTPLPRNIEIGQSLYLTYNFSDRDSDKEDTSKTSFNWYKNGTRVASTRSLQLKDSMVGAKLKGCVTAYAQTGLPKNSVVTCTPEETVWAVKDSKPRAMNIRIQGVRFGEHTLSGQYKYFDLNNDHQTSSLFEWSVIKNNIDTVVSRAQNYTLQISDEGKGNQIRFCVTPVNAKEKGCIECVTEDIAWFEGHGEFKEGGVITPYLAGYPDFKLSYWKSASKMLTTAMALDFTDNKVKPLAVDTADPSFSNLYPISLCVSVDDDIQNDDDICREMKANNKLKGGMIFDFNDHSRIAMNYKREVNVIVAGNKYRIRRPYTWAEFKELNLDKDPGFLSAEPSIIREGGNTVKGLKMTPKQANDFCLRTYGAPGVISSAINFSDGVIPSGKHQWPIYLSTQAYVTKEPNGTFVINSNKYIPADMNSKYAFACLAVVP